MKRLAFTNSQLPIYFMIVLTPWYRPTIGASYHSYPYLYGDKSPPVIEHIAPTSVRQRRSDHPEFLYNSRSKKYRVVEFYVHWCGVCRHFRPHYIDFARRTRELLAAKNHTSVDISFHAVSCVPNKALCQRQEVSGFPIVRIFRPGSTNGMDLTHSKVKPIPVLRALGIDTEGMVDDDPEDDYDETEQQAPTFQESSSLWRYIFNMKDITGGSSTTGSPHRVSRRDLQHDIELSFVFAIRNDIYMNSGELSEAKRKTLFNWFNLLQKTLPRSWDDFHTLLEQLLRNFQFVSKKEAYLLHIIEKYPLRISNSTEWSLSCSHGEEGRGFTCGLWELLHIVTVGVVEHNSDALEEKDLISPDGAAYTIRNYIEHFFHCQDCTEHFIRTYDTCAYGRCEKLSNKTRFNDAAEAEWKELPLWLYQVHNAVNLRLMQEKALREKRSYTSRDVVSVLWPPLEECRPCWRAPDGNGNPQWNDTMVYKFMHLAYGKRDLTSAEFTAELRKANHAAELRDGESSIPAAPRNFEMAHSSVILVAFVVYAFGRMKHRASIPRKTRTY